MEQPEVFQPATVEVEQMTTVAVLLAKRLAASVTPQKVSERRVRFLVVYDERDREAVREIIRMCDAGMYGIDVDVGMYQSSFRIVSSMKDKLIPRAAGS